ncbi:MAG: amidohydrolase family protein [Eubacteriaceae bacterium]|nr:amidohydrolase family protein [Eubacteriaceae bacterium]
MELHRKIIDIHTHAFPVALAKEAIPMMAAIASLTAQTDGSAPDLSRAMAGWGVSEYNIAHVATKPGQCEKVNAFAASCLSDTVHCFGSVHPQDSFGPVLSRFGEMGLSGVKLHPDYQGFFADSKQAYLVYEACAKYSLPIMLHCGYDPKSPDLVHCTPEMLAGAAAAFPQATFIGAHLGGMFCFDEVENTLAGTANVYIDISMMANNIEISQYRRIIAKHGAHRTLFGSDCPWSNPIKEYSSLMQLGLSDAEMDMICYKNARALLRIGQD